MIDSNLTASGVPVWRALMVTDLVRFTKILDKVGDAHGRDLMQWHNRLLRTCLRSFGGREHAHTGDGIIASFADPCAAVRCAIAVQRALNHDAAPDPELALRARIGVHAGRPLIDEGRLFGKCVNEAVRVCAQADSSQIFASRTIVESIVGSELDCQFKLKGMRCLKGIARPHAIYEVQWTRDANRHETSDFRPELAKLSAA